MVALAFFVVFALVYLAGFYSLDTGQALAQWAKGMVKFVLHFGFLVTGVALLARAGSALLLVRARRVPRRDRPRTPSTASIQLVLAEGGVNLDELLIEPITSRQTGINVFGAVGGTQEVFRPNALTGDPNHLGIELVIPLLVLTPLYLRLEAGHRLKTPLAIVARVPPPRRARDALAERAARARLRRARARAAVPPASAAARVPRSRSARSRVLVAAVIVVRLDFFLTVLRARTNTSRGSGLAALRGLLVRSGHPLDEPVPRPRPEQLRRLLRVRHRATGLRPALVLRRDDRRDRDRRRDALRRVRRLALPQARRRAADRARALRGGRSARRADPARGVGDDRRARRDARRERLLPHDDLLLLLRLRDARGRAARGRLGARRE